MLYDRYGYIREKIAPRHIYVQPSFKIVWEQMELLKSPKHVQKILTRAINYKFYGLDFDSILKQRNKLNGTRENSPCRFIQDKDINNQTIKIVNSIKQAYEYYKASKSVGPLTKPVLLYYGMVSLAKALINSTYILPKLKKPLGHGITVPKKKLEIEIKRNGEYQIFHDTFMGDTTIYTNPEKFINIELKNLLKVIPGIPGEWEIEYKGFPKIDINENPLHEKSGKYDKFMGIGTSSPYDDKLITSGKTFQVIYGIESGTEDEGKLSLPENESFVHIIDAHFLAMFILCSFARYKPLEWTNIIENSSDSNLFLINAFLRRSELDFPMLIYSEITGIKTIFSTFL